MNDPLSHLLRAIRARVAPATGGDFVLTDGAWGTQLQQRGLGPGGFPDLWNLTHPVRVSDVARAYVDAGSQVVLTNTFGANRIRLAEVGAGASLEVVGGTWLDASGDLVRCDQCQRIALAPRPHGFPDAESLWQTCQTCPHKPEAAK